jgi:hypothetical protein
MLSVRRTLIDRRGESTVGGGFPKAGTKFHFVCQKAKWWYVISRFRKELVRTLEQVLLVSRLKYFRLSPELSERCRGDLPAMGDNEQRHVILHTRRIFFLFIIDMFQHFKWGTIDTYS